MSTKPQDVNAIACDGNNKPSATGKETTAENKTEFENEYYAGADNGEIRSGFVCSIPV